MHDRVEIGGADKEHAKSGPLIAAAVPIATVARSPGGAAAVGGG